jgi:hypothetical protein
VGGVGAGEGGEREGGVLQVGVFITERVLITPDAASQLPSRKRVCLKGHSQVGQGLQRTAGKKGWFRARPVLQQSVAGRGGGGGVNPQPLGAATSRLVCS